MGEPQLCWKIWVRSIPISLWSDLSPLRRNRRMVTSPCSCPTGTAARAGDFELRSIAKSASVDWKVYKDIGQVGIGAVAQRRSEVGIKGVEAEPFEPRRAPDISTRANTAHIDTAKVPAVSGG